MRTPTRTLFWCSLVPNSYGRDFELVTRSSLRPLLQLFGAAKWCFFLVLLAKPSLVKYAIVEWPTNPRHPTSIGRTLHDHPFSLHSALMFSYRSFFRSKASSMFSSQGTVSSTRRIRLMFSDHTTMSGRSRVWTMWDGKWSASLRSAADFQSAAPRRNLWPCPLRDVEEGALPSVQKRMNSFLFCGGSLLIASNC